MIYSFYQFSIESQYIDYIRLSTRNENHLMFQNSLLQN